MERKERRFRRDGRALCIFVSERQITGIPRADALYERFCTSAEHHAEHRVTEQVAAQYEADENPRKKFRFSPALCRCRIAVTCREDAVEVQGEYVAAGRTVCRFLHRWDPALGLVLLPGRRRMGKNTGKIPIFRRFFR